MNEKNDSYFHSILRLRWNFEVIGRLRVVGLIASFHVAFSLTIFLYTCEIAQDDQVMIYSMRAIRSRVLLYSQLTVEC